MHREWNAYVREDLTIEPVGEGRLQGLTFSVKDVFEVKGNTNTAGNPDWFRTHKPALKHAAAIELLLKQGARLRGTTQTDELMFSLNGENFHYGTPVNPKDPDRIPGGSSSGSAVAVSAGLADFALGTDTGGSVRIPSAYCGIYGIRPTHGLVPVEGVIPLAQSFDTVGWMARDSKTLWDVGSALIESAEAESGEFRQVHFGTDAWDIVQEDCRMILMKWLPYFQQLTGKSAWIDIAPQGLDEWVNTFRTIQGYEIWSAHGEWIQREKPVFGPDIAERFAWASSLGKAEFENKKTVRQRICEYMDTLLGSDGLLVIPTAPGPAPKRGLAGTEIERTRSRVMQLSCVAGLTGMPQVTIPIAGAEGFPIGLSVIAGYRQDRKLLRWIHEKLLKAFPETAAIL